MKKQLYFLLFSGITISLLISCDTKQEPIPAYIHIDKFTLTTQTGEGTNSQKISDAWVYIDEKLIGAFELPVTFPVLYEGEHQLRIRAGIKVNGIAATRAPYPFYTHHVSLINLKAGEKLTINPSISYVNGTHFSFMENFDNVGILFANSPSGTDTSVQQIFSTSNPNVFEGAGSGIVYLTNTKTFFEAVSNTSYALPKGSAPVFLEMNYKCNKEFVVGMFIHSFGNTQKIAVLTLNPSETWNKSYLYLTPVISAGGNNATDYNMFFGMINNIGSDSLSLLLDNVKLVY